MCEPVSLGLMAATQAAGAGLQFAGQRSQANAQIEYQEELAKVRNEQMRTQHIRNEMQRSRRMEQAHAQKSQQAQNARRDRMRLASQANASAARAGVGGNSLDALLSDFMLQEDEFIGASRTSLGFLSEEQGVQREASRRDVMNFRMPSQAVQKPSAAALVLGLANTGLNAYLQTKR